MRLVFLQYTTKALLWYNEQCKMGEEVEKHEYLFISPEVESQIHIIQWFDLLNKYYFLKKIDTHLI